MKQKNEIVCDEFLIKHGFFVGKQSTEKRERIKCIVEKNEKMVKENSSKTLNR